MHAYLYTIFTYICIVCYRECRHSRGAYRAYFGWVYIHICVYTHTYLYIYIYVCCRECQNTYAVTQEVHICMYVCTPDHNALYIHFFEPRPLEWRHTYIFLYTSMYVYIWHTYIFLYTSIYVYICCRECHHSRGTSRAYYVQVCMYIYLYAYIYLCVYIHMYMYMYHIWMYTHVYVYVYMCI